MSGWHHFAVTSDGEGNTRYFWDGVLVDARSWPWLLTADEFADETAGLTDELPEPEED